MTDLNTASLSLHEDVGLILSAMYWNLIALFVADLPFKDLLLRTHNRTALQDVTYATRDKKSITTRTNQIP